MYNKANHHRANVVIHCFHIPLMEVYICVWLSFYLSRAEVYSVESALVFML